MMAFGRLLMIAGASALAAQALVPTYVEALRMTTVLTPVELWQRTGDAMWISWIILLPHLFGLVVAVVHIFDLRSTLVVAAFRGLVVVLLPALTVAAIAAPLVVVAGLSGHQGRWQTGEIIGVGAGAASIAAAVAAWAVYRSAGNAPPYLRLLLYQGVLALALAPWLGFSFEHLGRAIAEPVGLWIGAGAWVSLVVGTHFTAMTVRQEVAPPEAA